MFSMLESQVATLFADAILYGAYLATLLLCLWRLLYERHGFKPSHRIDWFMLIMAIAIFLWTTMDTALSIRRAMIYLPVMRGIHPNLLWSNMTMVILIHLQTLFLNAVLTYRCWIVFSRSIPVTVFPIAIWLVDFVCTIIRTYQQLKGANDAWTILIFWACSIALSLYASSMIAYRMTSIAKFKSLPIWRIRFVMRVIIESGLMYTMIAVMLSIAIFTNNTFVSTFLSAIYFEIAGITFNLLIIRAAPAAAVRRVQTMNMSTSQAPLTTVQFTVTDLMSHERDEEQTNNHNNLDGGQKVA